MVQRNNRLSNRPFARGGAAVCHMIYCSAVKTPIPQQGALLPLPTSSTMSGLFFHRSGKDNGQREGAAAAKLPWTNVCITSLLDSTRHTANNTHSVHNAGETGSSVPSLRPSHCSPRPPHCGHQRYTVYILISKTVAAVARDLYSRSEKESWQEFE